MFVGPEAAIIQGHRVRYREAHILLEEIADATADGSRKQLMAELSTAPLLIIDDFGMRKLPMTAAEAHGDRQLAGFGMTTEVGDAHLKLPLSSTLLRCALQALCQCLEQVGPFDSAGVCCNVRSAGSLPCRDVVSSSRVAWPHAPSGQRPVRSIRFAPMLAVFRSGDRCGSYVSDSQTSPLTMILMANMVSAASCTTVRCTAQQIVYRFRMKLISMSVGRASLGNIVAPELPICWAHGFRGLRRRPFIATTLKELDRYRERQIAILKNRLKTLRLPEKSASDDDGRRVLPFYGRPFSYWGQFRQ